MVVSLLRRQRQRGDDGGVDDVKAGVNDDDAADDRIVAKKKTTTTRSDGSTTDGGDQRCEDDDESDYRCFYFLTPAAARGVLAFHYKGEDRSYLYKYVLSPLAAFCVQRTPASVAPNTITLFGMLCMVAAYLCMWSQIPTMMQQQQQQPDADESSAAQPASALLLPPSPPPPRWIFLLHAVALLVYQTADNMDGKQARRTKSSSPLGLLFDHGCDAFNCFIGCHGWMMSMALYPGIHAHKFISWTILFGPHAIFYFATWEEYYTGEMILPELFNGPSEGLLGGALLSLVSWYYGPLYWHEWMWWEGYLRPAFLFVSSKSPLPVQLTERIMALRDIPNYKVLSVANAIVLSRFLYLSLNTVLVKMHFKNRKSIAPPLMLLLPFATLVACFTAVAWVDMDVWLASPRTSLHLFVGLFVEMSTAMQLAHVTGQDFSPLAGRWILLPLVLLTARAVVAGLPATSGEQRRILQDYLLIYCTAVWVYLACKVSIVIHELCVVLDIWCFDIVAPSPRSCAAAAAAKTAANDDDNKSENGQRHINPGSKKLE